MERTLPRPAEYQLSTLVDVVMLLMMIMRPALFATVVRHRLKAGWTVVTQIQATIPNYARSNSGCGVNDTGYSSSNLTRSLGW